MQANGVNQALAETLNNSLFTVGSFIPRFLSGLIVLVIGIIIATFLRQIVLELFKFINLDGILKRYGVPDKKEGVDWSNIIAELVRWFVIVLFLIPTADVWGLSQFVTVLNGLLLYLPNVFVAVLLLLVGFVISRLVHDLVLASIQGVSKDTSRTVAMIARWAVLIFVFLIVLNQLGIASDLIRIIFTGLIAMIAIAGGLAFGLGGQEAARELLSKFIKKM
jgi:hypothetical protein